MIGPPAPSVRWPRTAIIRLYFAVSFGLPFEANVTLRRGVASVTPVPLGALGSTPFGRPLPGVVPPPGATGSVGVVGVVGPLGLAFLTATTCVVDAFSLSAAS